MKISKKLRREFLRFMLGHDRRWAIKGMLKVYEWQTEDEKSDGHTKHWNSVGFSGVDSEILSSFVKWYKKKGWLSEKQMKIVFRSVPKYWGQLMNVMDMDKLDGMIWKYVRAKEMMEEILKDMGEELMHETAEKVCGKRFYSGSVLFRGEEGIERFKEEVGKKWYEANVFCIYENGVGELNEI